MGLKNVEKRIVIKVDLESKNSWKFSSGQTIRLERDVENLNKRETQPVNATVISADYIEDGCEVLIHHNCTHEVNRVYDYENLSGEAEASSVKYFSIPESDCYAWRDKDGELKPMKDFEFALRVFKPYGGIIAGIEPELIKNVLYLTTGNLKGFVVGVLKASDYEIVFQGLNGREERIIRIRHSEDEDYEREEVIYIDHHLTEKINNCQLYVGLSASDCQPIKTTADEIESSINHHLK
jgi:hypothetical protein